MLSTFVKVGRISNLSDARYCAGMMVDALGFTIDPSSADYIDPDTFKGISQWVSGPEIIGEIGLLDVETAILSARNYGFETVEVVDPGFIQPMIDAGFKVGYRTSDPGEIDRITSTEYIIVELSDNTLPVHADDVSNVLISSPEISAIAQKIKSGPFKGIELLGTPEEKPGFKDYGEVMDVLEMLETSS